MLSLGSLAFATPWVLTALVALPAIWWLLRVTPPPPRVLRFPAVSLLRDLVHREETPARTPWWLLLLRLLLAAFVILALSAPILNPNDGMPGSGPVVLTLDNGWAAGRDWPSRQAAALEVIAQAERQDRQVIVLATAPGADGTRPQPTGLLRPTDARRLVQTLAPHPWPVDRTAAAEGVRGLALSGSAHAVWIADGLDAPGTEPLALALQGLGGLELRVAEGGRLARLLLPPATDGADLVLAAIRPRAGPSETAVVLATAEDGRLLTRAEAVFRDGERRADARLRLPADLRNQVAAMRIEGEGTAGATVLIDERWRRRPVGLVSGRAEQAGQPLLSDLHYLDRALSPTSEVRRGTITELLNSGIAMLILSDVGALSAQESDAIRQWIERGGVLLRFAGPLLAQNADALLPVRLRPGDRQLGGALAWDRPMPLAPFPPGSPFAGLAVPADVLVSRQVLAEPSLDLPQRSWANLADGTPLVTGERRGDGHVVLVHTTANPDWSNLPLSGLYVEMLRRLARMSVGTTGEATAGPLAPIEVLDGFGRLGAPPASAFPLSATRPRDLGPGPQHPPGFYGTPESRVAFNLTATVTDVAPIGALPPGVSRTGFGGASEIDLKPWLLGIAMAIALIDLLIALGLRGLLLPRRIGRSARTAAAAGLAIASVALWSGEGAAQQSERDGKAIRVTQETHLAYVATGDSAVDLMSQAGLDGLSAVLSQRTSVEARGAVAVDLEGDELAFYPLLYWPMTPEQRPLSPRAVENVNRFLRFGGTILLDTRDSQFGNLAGTGPGTAALRRLTAGLDIPPLAPVPPDHVLTKAFYLMQDFPGRFAAGDVWVEVEEGRSNDGVSSVIIGGNDWAAAWAIDRRGSPLAAVVPGGERQRERARRFGVNLVMYVLTGNYKADQVHVPAILERLGQ